MPQIRKCIAERAQHARAGFESSEAAEVVGEDEAVDTQEIGEPSQPGLSDGEAREVEKTNDVESAQTGLEIE